MLESIKNINGTELNENSEKLLNSMKKLRHTANDVIGTAPLKELKQGCYNLVINVGDDEYPIYYNATTVFADGSPEITDDIYDEENYLGVTDDDEMMWFALVLQLTHQVDLLQNENNQLREANKKCTEYGNDIGKLEVDNLSKITELENENESLKKKLFCGVPTKFGEQERGTPEDKVVKMDMEMAIMHQNNLALNSKVTLLTSSLDAAQKEINNLTEELNGIKNNNAFLKKEKQEAELLAYRLTRGDMHVQFDSMKSLEHENGVLKNENADLNQKLYQKEDEDDLRKRIGEYAQKNSDLLECNKRLRQEISKLRVQFNSYSGTSVVDHDDMQHKITQETMAELTARINELEEKLKDKDERIDQLSKNNSALSIENKNFGDMLKEADRTARFYAREVDNLEKEIKDLQSAKADSDLEPHVVTANDDMQYTVSLEKMNEVTARIKELESINENLQKENEEQNKDLQFKDNCIFDLSKNNGTLSADNQNLKEQIENLQKENEDFERVASAHLETTQKFADYKERQKRLYKHFKNLAEMIEDLMEMDDENR